MQITSSWFSRSTGDSQTARDWDFICSYNNHDIIQGIGHEKSVAASYPYPRKNNNARELVIGFCSYRYELHNILRTAHYADAFREIIEHKPGQLDSTSSCGQLFMVLCISPLIDIHNQILATDSAWQGVVISGAIYYPQLWCTDVKGPVFVTIFNHLSTISEAALAYFIFSEKLYFGK
ncbi:hypothetical protein ACFE04_006516 [Oxalis oulophora]